MASSWHAILIKCKYEPRIIPILLAFTRILICFWPQTGYLHPDEFFQSTDVVAGQYFSSNVQPVWEFKTNRPIRCMLIPNLLNNLAFGIVTLFQARPNAYMLLVAPRLAYTLLSFIVDFSLYKLSQYYSSRGLWYLPISVIFQSSFVCIGCLTRSLSNTPEVVIFSLLLVVVCKTIRPRFRIFFVTPKRSTPVNERVKSSKQFMSSVSVGILITLGTFNRPTFPCFALVPSIYWFIESLRRNSYNASLTIKRAIVPLAISATLTGILISAYDTLYYIDRQVLKDLLNHLFEYDLAKVYSLISSQWLFTPYNFILYNTNVKNLSKYGLHLPYTHMAVNIPLAFNVLGLMFYAKLFSILVDSDLYRLILSTYRVYTLMLLSTLTSTILLSFCPHQEFRFLLPLIVPMVYVFAFNLYTSNRLLSIWLLTNVILIYFYANIHQAGVTRASLDMDPILKSYQAKQRESDLIRVNVVALRCYLVPSYQWNIPKNDLRFNFDLQDTFEDFDSSLNHKVGRVIDEQREYPAYSHYLYIMMPKLYEQELTNYLHTQYSINSSNLHHIGHYTPHFSGEELSRSVNHVQQFGLGAWREAFGFSLLQVDLTS